MNPIQSPARHAAMGYAYALPKRRNTCPVPLDYARMTPLLAGRLAVVTAVLVFVSVYVFGIWQHGLWLGIGLGWLPAAGLAWTSAACMAPVATLVLVGLVKAHKRLASLRI